MKRPFSSISRPLDVTLTICQCGQCSSFSIQLCWRATARRGVDRCFFQTERPRDGGAFLGGPFLVDRCLPKKGKKTQKGGKHFLFSRIVSAFSIQLCWRATARRGVVRCSKKKNIFIVPGTSNGFLDSPAGV